MKILKHTLGHKSYRQEDWIVQARKEYAENAFKKKRGNCIELLPQDCSKIDSFWKNFHPEYAKLFNVDQYKVYKKYLINDAELSHYIPDDFYYCYADTYFTDYHTSIIFDNKNYYDLYFNDFRTPECIGRNIDGVMMDKNYNSVSLDVVAVC